MTWLISLVAVEMLLVQGEHANSPNGKTGVNPKKPHSDFLDAWEKAMSKGTLNGKVYSQRTIDDYLRYARLYFSRHQSLSITGVKKELSAVPAEHFAKREHYYKALLCFGRFLAVSHYIPKTFFEEMKPLYPKRHKPPKRFTVDEAGIEKLLAACDTLQERIIVTLLANTGLRASEACALQWEDIDLDRGFLVVRCGKGGKMRRVGLTSGLIQLLGEYRQGGEERLWAAETAGPSDWLLPNRIGQAMDNSGLHQRLARIGLKAGVKVSPHALRRAFVTINAGKGRSLVHLQKACGHTSVQTTEAYCMTTEQEVIEAMKGWD